MRHRCVTLLLISRNHSPIEIDLYPINNIFSCSYDMRKLCVCANCDKVSCHTANVTRDVINILDW